MHAQQPSVDSLTSLYKLATTQLSNQQYDASYATARAVTQGFLQAGDTLRACKAMDLQALASINKPRRAYVILDTALKVYRTSIADTSVTYFRLLTDQSRMCMEMGDFQASMAIAKAVDGLVEPLLKIDTAKGYGAVFNYYRENATVKNCVIGLAAKDLTQVTVKHIELIDNETAFAAYQKKPEYGPATIVVEQYKALGNKQLHDLQTGSSLTIDGKRIEGSR